VAGLDYIIQTRQKHYLRQRHERTLKKGDRVALLGRGIAVVEQADERETVVILGKNLALRIARKDFVLNQHNLRWECVSRKRSNQTELRAYTRTAVVSI
jgi:preprotein translocase subunit YajC